VKCGIADYFQLGKERLSIAQRETIFPAATPWTQATVLVEVNSPWAQMWGEPVRLFELQ